MLTSVITYRLSFTGILTDLTLGVGRHLEPLQWGRPKVTEVKIYFFFFPFLLSID